MGQTTPLEIVKYIKVPDRRLTSGFLTVNVVHHDDNDDLDDASQEYYDGFGGGENFEKTFPFNNKEPNDPDRAGYRHTFGDYDCLLFWVAGGMTIQPPIFSGGMRTVDLFNAGYLSANSSTSSWLDTGAAYFDTETWYSDVKHTCQHFLKSHLIGRINNGYGHVANDSVNPQAAYYKIPPIPVHSFEYDDDTTFTEDITQTSSFRTHDHTGTATGNAPAGGGAITSGVATIPPVSRSGNNQRYIVSNGTFSNDDDGDFITDLSDASKNTYFPMVEGVEVYGKHDYTIPTHSNSIGDPSSGTFVYTNGNSTVGNYSHQDDFWSMVVKIKIRGWNSVGGGTGQSDTEFFKTRTNVMWQPFGETASFNIANSLHT